MELNKIVIGTLLIWKQLFGIIAEQVDVMDFVCYTTYAAVRSNKDSDIISAAIHPDITDELYIGIALSPFMDGTRYEETPETRTESTEEDTATVISSTLFPSDTMAWYTDVEDSYNSFRIRIDKHRDIWDRVGVFYTKAVLNGFRTAIATLPLLSDEGNVQPIDRVVTVSVGDTAVTLTVETDESSLRWRKDGGSEIEEWNDLSSVTINNVRFADAGIYECYVTDTRSEAEHAFIVLHVRTCPASRWSPPLCLSWCPVCYNGGVCDVDFGICLCTVGFKGDYCETSAGGNTFGRYGTVECTTDTTKECKKKLFCGQDPVGCTCASGWKGLACETECETGMYGNGCLQECHCDDDSCDHSYGCDINVQCHEGFVGERCLTPIIEECDVGFYGEFCNLECHCADSDPCAKPNASCPGSCAYGWAGSHCLIALPALYDAPSIESNASNIRVVWTAWDQNHDFGNRDANSYVLKYWKTASADEATTIDNIAENQIEISISSIDYNQSHNVTVSVNADIDGVSTQGIASPVTAFGPIEPPSFSSNPCNFNRLANFSTVVTCDTWSYDAHNGMGIVQGYTIQYWNVNTPSILYSVIVDKPLQSESYTVLLPEVYVYYSFEVVVMVNYERDGATTIGTPSSSLSLPKGKVPDLTAFSATHVIVDSGTKTEMRAYIGREDGDNENVMFGIGLWVDDNGTHYGENELINLENNLDDSIFTSGTTYEACKQISRAYWCWLKFPPIVAEHRVGVKYMWTELNGYIASTSMVFLTKEANVIAEHRTITTSIGETVELVITLNGVESSSLRWKKDGGSNIMELEGLSNVTIENVRKKDAGIYECYLEGQRDQGQHAIVRVLVRECPHGKWLPPNCEDDCPICYNGGACSAQFGSCICPPGFTGDNCQEACGHNTWGRDCTILCSSGTPGCPGFLFCPPDPVGCSCMSGYGDLDCIRVCDTGTTGKYGPGCLLDCHCDASECQSSEGCNRAATCHTGYTGTSCLERDPDVECPDGVYGPQCTKICHCEGSSKCDRNTGSCPGGDVCEEGWAGAGCQQALPALSDAPLVGTFANNVKINWLIWSLDNDYGRTGTVDSYQLEFWPTNDTNDLVVLNITMGTELNISWTQLNYNTEYSFTVKVVTDVEGVLVVGKHSPLTVYTIYPPALQNPPTFISRSSLGINVTWIEWTFDLDDGIGLVIGYVVEWWDAGAAWNVSNITSYGEPSEGILIPNTPYYSNVVVQITTLYNNSNSEGIGTPSPLLVVYKETCPYGWNQFQETCYLFGDSVVNWNDAISLCQQENATLVSITAQTENDFVTSQANSTLHVQLWIGLKFITPNWYWTSGETFAFHNWQGPVEFSVGECAQFDSASGFWSNVPCESSQNRAVCEKDVQKFGCLDGSWHGYKEECYRHYSNLSSRLTAKSSCRELRNADLVSIHSQEEDEFVQAIIRYYDGYSWNGLLNSSDGILWSDGTDVNYDKIIDTGEVGRCVVYNQEDHVFSWKIQLCAFEYAYVCKDMRAIKAHSHLDIICLCSTEVDVEVYSWSIKYSQVWQIACIVMTEVYYG